MTVSPDIDKVWQALNKRPAPRAKSTTTAGVVPDNAGKDASKAARSSVKHPQQELQSLQITTQITTCALPAESQLTYEDLERKLQRDLESLKAQAVASRIRALRNLKASFVERLCQNWLLLHSCHYVHYCVAGYNAC